MADGHGTLRLPFAYNYFIIVGPEGRSRRRRGADGRGRASRPSPPSFPFVSRGDESGTHKKELKLWESAGLTPSGDWYLSTGQGMGETLRIASEKQGYTLTDLGTFLAQSDSSTWNRSSRESDDLKNVYDVDRREPERVPCRQRGRRRAARAAARRARRARSRSAPTASSSTASRCSCRTRTASAPTDEAEQALQVIWDGLVEALRLLFGGDADVFEIALRSLCVSGLALLFAVVIGVPAGGLIALSTSAAAPDRHCREHRHGGAARGSRPARLAVPHAQRPAW